MTERFVREHRKNAARLNGLKGFEDPRIRARGAQQPLVVELEKARQTRFVNWNAGGRQRSLNQYGGTVADHAADPLFFERRTAALADECVRGVSEVPPGVDERAVEVEDNQRRFC